jgi:hypothetical protein
MRACNWGGNQSQMREAIRGVHARLLLAQTQDLDDQRRIRLARSRHEGPVEALAHLMREAIKCNQRQSAAISGNQRSGRGSRAP